MLNKKKIEKVIDRAHAQGYGFIPRGRRLSIVAKTWAIRCDTDVLPVTAALKVVKDAGYLPGAPMKLQASAENQPMLEEMALESENNLWTFDAPDSYLKMKKIPVIFKDRWQLYQTENGDIYAFDTELLAMIDFAAVTPDAYISVDMPVGVWVNDRISTLVYIAPGRFSAEDSEKIIHLEKYDWARQTDYSDSAVNISLFDNDDDVPVPEKTEE